MRLTECTRDALGKIGAKMLCHSLGLSPHAHPGEGRRKHEFVAANVPLNLTEWRFCQVHETVLGSSLKLQPDENLFLELALRGYDLLKLRDEETAEVVKIG